MPAPLTQGNGLERLSLFQGKLTRGVRYVSHTIHPGEIRVMGMRRLGDGKVVVEILFLQPSWYCGKKDGFPHSGL